MLHLNVTSCDYKPVWHTVDRNDVASCLALQMGNHTPTDAHVDTGPISTERDTFPHPFLPWAVYCIKCSLGGIQDPFKENTKSIRDSILYITNTILFIALNGKWCILKC